jgi:hypothetical protein
MIEEPAHAGEASEHAMIDSDRSGDVPDHLGIDCDTLRVIPDPLGIVPDPLGMVSDAAGVESAHSGVGSNVRQVAALRDRLVSVCNGIDAVPSAIASDLLSIEPVE